MSDEKQNYPKSGTVEWIGLRPSSSEPMQEVDSVQVDLELGLIGDRFKGSAGAPRQVTLIQREHLAVVAQLLDQDSIDPALTRRNILVSGINLTSLKEKTIQIGTVKLQVNGGCPPCGKMEANLGKGGYNAMRGHGGIIASVVEPGTINVGDRVQPLVQQPSI